MRRGLNGVTDELVLAQPLITPYLESRCVAVQMQDERISHVIIENVSGRQAIACAYAIDASGNGALIRATREAGRRLDCGAVSSCSRHPCKPF